MSFCKPIWLEKAVKGVLLDITGVLYNSGQGSGEAIPGSINAVNRYKAFKGHGAMDNEAFTNIESLF